MVKLNVYLARCGAASRRKADELIKKGMVTLNGKTVIEPYAEVCGDTDVVTVNKKRVFLQKAVYIALNKPEGYTCTLKDRFASRKVTELIPGSMGKVFPAGRLDKNTSGLLILTTDGNFAQKLAHPRLEVEKEYEAEVAPLFNRRHLSILKKGVADGGERLRASSGRLIKDRKDLGRSIVSLVMKQGRKREVRRMFERLGYEIISLKRVRIGNVCLGDLKSGSYRELASEEINFFMKRTAGRKPGQGDE